MGQLGLVTAEVVEDVLRSESVDDQLVSRAGDGDSYFESKAVLIPPDATPPRMPARAMIMRNAITMAQVMGRFHHDRCSNGGSPSCWPSNSLQACRRECTPDVRGKPGA